MNSNDEKIRASIADQAGEWYVANAEGSLDARDSAALATWFRASPAHIEEFLGVSAVVRDLKDARSDPNYSLEAILARARAEDDEAVHGLWPRVTEAVRGQRFGGWLPAAATIAVIALLGAGALLWLTQSPIRPFIAPDDTTALQFETRRGEQLTRRLEDDSVLHLNTDSAVSVRYSKGERLLVLVSGEAAFEVAHDAQRAFRVRAGSAEVIDLGTKFDVRMDQGSTVVTVIEGRVTVGPAASSRARPHGPIELSDDQQVRVTEDSWPAVPAMVDAKRTTAWLHRQIVFDNQPLERVAAEYNRYTARQIEIATPALRSLRVSGVFATDDTDAFIAFLRSLRGVHVAVAATQIRVSGGTGVDN